MSFFFSRASGLFVFSCLVAALVASPASLGQSTATPATNPPAPSASPGGTAPAQTSGPAVDAKILSVTVLDFKECPNEFAVGKDIVLALDKDPRTWLPGKKLVLFMNGTVMKGLDPLPVPDSPNSVRFHLGRSAENQDAWAQMFARKSFRLQADKGCNCTEGESVSVTVGLEDGSHAATSPATLCLEFLPDALAAWVVFPLSILVAVVTILLGWKTSLLRDSGDPRDDNKLGTYSLGRFQMAIWFVTVVFSYLFIFAATGSAPVIPQGTLILMGIGAGTALGAAAIDLNKRTASRQDLANLTAESQVLPKEIQDLQDKIKTLASGDPNLLIRQKQPMRRNA